MFCGEYDAETAAESLEGIIPATCSHHPVRLFPVMFEFLAKTLAIKARQMDIHLTRQTVNVCRII
jgi:hypothetical protein